MIDGTIFSKTELPRKDYVMKLTKKDGTRLCCRTAVVMGVCLALMARSGSCQTAPSTIRIKTGSPKTSLESYIISDAVGFMARMFSDSRYLRIRFHVRVRYRNAAKQCSHFATGAWRRHRSADRHLCRTRVCHKNHRQHHLPCRKQ